MLNRNLRLPLYVQLEKLIQEQILIGHWQPGEQIPTESELCQTYQVSRITVRQAITELVKDGYLERFPGRGTFVVQLRIEQPISRLTGFTQDMNARGKQPGARVIQFERVEAPQAVSRALAISPQQQVLLLKRLRLADNEPLAIESAYLSTDLCRSILEEDFVDRSLYAVLAAQCGLEPSRAVQQWAAVACPKDEARLLGIGRGEPVLHIYRTTFNQEDQPFEWVESFYRGDKYIFYAELYNQRTLLRDASLKDAVHEEVA